MEKNGNMLTQQQFETLLREQESKGYPNFKNRIAKKLISEYGVSGEDAFLYAFHPEVDEKLMKDIEWAQHMGSEYWAEAIYDKYLSLQKKMIS